MSAPTEVGPHPTSGGIAYLTPLFQAELVGGFTSVALLGYSIMLWLNDRDRVPPWWFFLLVAITYAICWGSFYIPGITSFLKYAPKIFSITSGVPLDADPSWHPVRVEVRDRDYKYPKYESARVQILALFSILFACWFTIYLGGPFQSAYSQVVLAMPLLAPNIARSHISIAAVYLATFVSALGFEFFATRATFSDVTTQSPEWYYVTTAGVLLVAAYVAIATRRNLWKASRGDAASPERS